MSSAAGGIMAGEGTLRPAAVAVPALAHASEAPAAAGWALCGLLAIAQIALLGYQLGVGNQTIQIAFLERWADPGLFAADRMVSETMPLYPSYFFRMLAPLLHWLDVGPLYLLLQMVTGFLTLAATYSLSRSLFQRHWPALAAAALLVLGNLQPLAGDALYSQGFTHTYAALPIAIAALALAFGRRAPSRDLGGRGKGWGRWIGAFALAGLLFNIHALTAAYLLLMLAAGLLAELWESPPWQWLGLALVCGTVAELLAAPTLWMMAAAHQTFSEQWVNLMRIRSADHSFPSSWWATGDPDVPRFVLVFALFVLAQSFPPIAAAAAGSPVGGDSQGASADGQPPASSTAVRRIQRMTLLMTLALVAFFAVGYVLTEVWPVPVMIRLQPFRASRLLLVLMLVYIAHGAVCQIMAALRGRSVGQGDAQGTALSPPARVVEFLCAVLVLATAGLPWLLPLLPFTLLVAMAGALAVGHLSWRQAIVGAAALLVALLAHRQIDFPLPLLASASFAVSTSAGGLAALAALGWTALAAAVLMAIVVGILDKGAARAAVTALTAALALLMGVSLYARDTRNGNEAGMAGQSLDIADVAHWARTQTPRDTLFLTPTGFSGFRILAERSLVGDWRDGTQLYFDAAFGPAWLERVLALEPGLMISDDGRRLLSRGTGLDTLSDQAVLELAKRRFHADYIVLPTSEQPRTLVTAFKGAKFTVYEPRTLAIAAAPPPSGILNPAAWNDMEHFMSTTVQQNIEKYRKADLTIQLVDTTGGPLQEIPVRLDETKSAFVFSGSLGYFESNNEPSADGDLQAPLVRPVELEKFPEVFNGSLIPFPGKWAAIEPEKNVYHWSDLDKYINYCAKNDLTVEYHHLSGVRPIWVAEMGGPGGQYGLNFGPVNPQLQTEFNRHCLAVVDRYHDRVKYFQVVNEKYMMEYVPAAWKLLKQKYPDVLFGVSDCVNFWMPGPAANNDQFKGFDAIKWLRDRGIQPDFFSMHGHHPSNLWSDPREMYAVFDRFKDAHIRVHVSEEYLRLNGQINGPVRTGILTPELQAEYLARYYTVCFSHPSVDLVNLWGAVAAYGWSNSGIIDAQGKPLPAFETLRKLFNETFQTHLKTQSRLDGTVQTRAFHGAYRLTIKLPGGREASAPFDLPQVPEAHFKFKLDADKGTLEVVK